MAIQWINKFRGHLLIAVLALTFSACGGDGGGGEPPPGGGEVPPDIALGVQINNKPIVYGEFDLDGKNVDGSNRTEDFVDLTAGAFPTTSPADVPTTKTWHIRYQPPGSNVQVPQLTANGNGYNFYPDKTVEGTYVLELEFTAEGFEGSVSTLTTVDVYKSSTVSASQMAWITYHANRKTGCVNCHNPTTAPSFTNKLVLTRPADHIDAGDTCQACHTIRGFDVLFFVDHEQILGNCKSCHDGQTSISGHIIIGQSPYHIQTDAECDECHDTTSFLKLEADGTFNHDAVDTEPCSRCHDGIRAKGKKVGHTPTNAECNVCHLNFNSFVGGADHGAITEATRCDSCHGAPDGKGGLIATGQEQAANHPDTGTLDCRQCHSVTHFKFAPGEFNHRSVINIVTEEPCVRCHDGNHTAAGALGQDNTTHDHTADVNSLQCQLCHSTDYFKPASVDHTQLVIDHARCDDAGCHDVKPVGQTPRGLTPNHIDLNLLGTDANGKVLDCITCHEAGGNFANGLFAHDTYLTIVPNVSSDPIACSTCHDDTHAIGQAINHIPTNSQDCVICHSTTTFAGATVDHTGLTTCKECHSAGNGATPQTRNHVPTTGECISCHAYPSFKPVTQFDHNAVDTSSCKACHDGSYVNIGAKAKNPDTHIPTVADCDTCHKETTTFTTGNYDHAGVTTGCRGCHNGNFTTTNGDIKGMTSNHIPVTTDCSNCHSAYPAAWITIKGPAEVHKGIISNCQSCHADGNTFAGNPPSKPNDAIHNATTSDCNACHVTPASLAGATFKTSANLDHTDAAVTTKNCYDCHLKTGIPDPQYNGTAQAMPQDQRHLALSPTQDCSACHAAGGSFIPAIFDHNNIAPTKRCDDCHGNTNPTGNDIAAKGYNSATHLDPAGRDCRECHNTTSFVGGFFDHSGVKPTDVCGDCHNSGGAPGKPIYHVPTADDCRACHQTTGWIPATFDHNQSQIGGKRCDSCHGFVPTGATKPVATGKTANHVVTNQDCGTCHTTDVWIPANFSHANLGPNDSCGTSTCHGSGGSGKQQPPTHFNDPTGRDCRACHNTTTFVGGTFDHLNISGRCDTCHNGAKASGRDTPPGHIAYDAALDCGYCHDNPPAPFTSIVSFDHTGVTGVDYDKMDGHRRNPTCTACHGNKIVHPFVWKFGSTNGNPTLENSCAGCHKNNFRSNGSHNGGRNGTVEQNKDCSGGGRGCHKVSSSGFG